MLKQVNRSTPSSAMKYIKCTQLEADLKSEVKKCANLSRGMNELKKEKAELKEDVLDVQSRSMRDNLLFQGEQ